MPTRTSLVAASAATASLVLAGCSTSETAPDSSAAGVESPAASAISVAAAFYPLEFVAEHVGGDLATVVPLTAPGVEAHDLELSPAAVREVQGVDLILFLSDFQPAVDDAVETTGVRSFDAHHIVEAHEASHAEDDHGDEESHEDDDHGHEEEAHSDEDDHGHEDEAHEDEAHEDDDHGHEDEVEAHEDEPHEDEAHAGHDHSSGDPHFWLDPTLLAEYAGDVAAELSDIDPDNADTYASNAESLAAELLELDQSYTDTLAQCERSDIFVSHEAFGYLTERFGLEQHGLSGLDPEAEPSPARVREVRDEVLASGATTVYSESDVDAAAIEALAGDAGVETAVLDPIEGVTGDDDYIEVMTRNLEALRAGLDCA
ncbi:metal ABC transporter solute-binding protein, Zn/Mn family [Demequina sp. SO4-18]|uniref:metal ABC transporter substrate-binding protein n=1 Tax=Demequina sp. SO4-18 TaxID=3401026 RepID=UPI003B58FB47